MSRPYSFQLQDVRKIHRCDGRALVGYEMGLGKSFLSLFHLHRHPELRPAVVICRSSLKFVWENEASKHFGMRTELLETRRPKRGGFRIQRSLVVINYDILAWWVEWLKDLKPKCVIIDECQALQNMSAKWTQAAVEVCQGVPSVLALSGTPLLSRPIELFPTLNILWPEKFDSIYPFGHRYCDATKNRWGGWDFKGATNLDELHQRLVKLGMLRRLKREVYKQLPDKTRSVIPLPIRNRKEYTQARDDFVEWMRKHNPKKLRRAVKAQRLVQMGYLKRLAGRLKLPAVMDWVDTFLEDSEGKLVLFAVHRKVITALRERYHNLCVVVEGSTSSKDRRRAVDQFQIGKKTRLFIGNIRAAGVGLTLTAASTVAFAELDWTPGSHVQAEDRVHRIGQKSRADVYYLVGKDTIEVTLAKLIQDKARRISTVLDGGKQRGDIDIHDLLIAELLKGERR